MSYAGRSVERDEDPPLLTRSDRFTAGIALAASATDH